jgi:hypothetical protein
MERYGLEKRLGGSGRGESCETDLVLLKSHYCSDGLFIFVIGEQPEHVQDRLHSGPLLAECSYPCLGPLLAGGEDVNGVASLGVDECSDYSCMER